MGLRKLIKKAAPVIKSLAKNPALKKFAPLALGGVGLGGTFMLAKQSGGLDVLKGLAKRKKSGGEIAQAEIPKGAGYVGSVNNAPVKTAGLLGMGNFLGFL